MNAIWKDITIQQGTDFNEPFLLGHVGSLAGAAAAMQIRTSVDSSTALATLTTWQGTLILNELARTLTPVIDETLSASLPAGQCIYDVKLMDSQGFTQVVYQGYANVERVVTTIPIPAPAPAPAPAPSPSPSPSPSPAPAPSPSPSPAPTGGAFNFSNPANSAYAAII